MIPMLVTLLSFYLRKKKKTFVLLIQHIMFFKIVLSTYKCWVLCNGLCVLWVKGMSSAKSPALRVTSRNNLLSVSILPNPCISEKYKRTLSCHHVPSTNRGSHPGWESAVCDCRRWQPRAMHLQTCSHVNLTPHPWVVEVVMRYTRIWWQRSGTHRGTFPLNLHWRFVTVEKWRVVCRKQRVFKNHFLLHIFVS